MREGLYSTNRGEDMGKEQGGTSSRTKQEVHLAAKSGDESGLITVFRTSLFDCGSRQLYIFSLSYTDSIESYDHKEKSSTYSYWSWTSGYKLKHRMTMLSGP
ncbi:unnamed protein product [Sphagnum jensenii]|uniref:Uncharacterized protein n=1 Tax=Sphagnum jensenii TaxID=128206 RepID=A0ABP1AN12_9BRYO